MLGIVEDLEADFAGALQCIHERRDGPVAPASDPLLAALDAQWNSISQSSLAADLTRVLVADQGDGPGPGEVLGDERLPDAPGGELGAAGVGDALDAAAELDLQLPRQPKSVVLLQHEGDASLSRLTVDADHRLVAASQVLRVDGQVGNLPVVALGSLERRNSLLDGVLVRAGKGGVDELARVGVARMDRNPVAVLGHPYHLVDVPEGELRGRFPGCRG